MYVFLLALYDARMADVKRKAALQPTYWKLRTAAPPPHAYFIVSAVFHYLGPAFAVLLFAHLAELGVAWLRIASAAAVFALWRRPWRLVHALPARQLRELLALGCVLGLMNGCFYLAIARLPLGTVGAIEFLGPITLAAVGVRSRRNLLAVALASVGVALLTEVSLAGSAIGLVFALANCLLFTLYILLGHRLAENGAVAGVDRLGAAMLIALVVATPFGFTQAAPAFTRPELLLAGIGVGICSSVIPYVCDQFAMARLPRASFALLLALLPATAVLVGLLVLRQVPSGPALGGVVLIIAGIAVHRPGEPETGR
jgi:inner membrane transporter RhtA